VNSNLIKADEYINDLNIQGYSIIPGFLQNDEIHNLKSLVINDADELKDKKYPGYSDIRKEDEQIFNLQNKNVDYLNILSAPLIERILMKKLNDEYYPALPDDQPNYILGEYIARTSGAKLRLHIDSWLPALGDNTWMMQVVFALEDRTEEDGCTIVVPGSHLSGKYTDRDYKHVIPLTAKAGDMIVWDSRLWHGAMPCVSKKKSWVLVATFQRWWVKQRFDMPKSLPKSIYKSLSEKQKVLLGCYSIPPADEFAGTNTRAGYNK
tara:strand:- start:25016 stop:25810 length:795 start_codon:yes stop_codon:yes gene_type:complete